MEWVCERETTATLLVRRIERRRITIGKCLELPACFPEYKEALEGLEGFSHIFVIAYFHRLRPEQIGPLKVKPRGLLKHGFKLEELPLIGVFALDSPTRPNPIGLSLVPLLRIEGSNLVVSDLDFFDGTPVLDIKPYQPSYRADNYRLPQWHTKLSEKAGYV